MKDLITLGETMVSFVPSEACALRYAHNYGMHIAGAESNTAIGLAKLGFKASWISSVGKDEFGSYIINQIRAEGVDTSYVKVNKDKSTGVMFKETSAGETKVFYYREGSAASNLNKQDIKSEWFEDCKILHMTGITPVLSDECLGFTKEVFKKAEEKGIKISFDPNIRKKLWKDKDYTCEIRDLALRSNILLMGLDEAEVLFGTRESDEIFKLIFTEGKAKYVALKDGANGSIISDGIAILNINPIKCNCIDPIGAGDAYNAGFIAGILLEKSIEEIGKMASICGGLATETLGDIEGYPSIEKVNSVLNNTGEVFR